MTPNRGLKHSPYGRVVQMGNEGNHLHQAAKGRPQDRAGAIQPHNRPRGAGARRKRPSGPTRPQGSLIGSKTKPDTSRRCGRRHRRRKRRGARGRQEPGASPATSPTRRPSRLGLSPRAAPSPPFGHPSRLELAADRESEPGGEEERIGIQSTRNPPMGGTRAAARLAGAAPPATPCAAARVAGQGPARSQRARKHLTR